MGYPINTYNDHKQKSQKSQSTTTNDINQIQSASQTNANLYQYYQQLIIDYSEHANRPSDKLALSLILTRGNRGTNSKNRQLALLDIDKLISFNNKSLKQQSDNVQNMRMATDLSGLRSTLLPLSMSRQRNQEENQERPIQNRQNGQIFRLVRAAQRHFVRLRGNRGEQQQNIQAQ